MNFYNGLWQKMYIYFYVFDRLVSTALVINQVDLDLEPMTFILKFDLDMVKMCLYTRNQVPRSEIITNPHTRIVKNSNGF